MLNEFSAKLPETVTVPAVPAKLASEPSTHALSDPAVASVSQTRVETSQVPAPPSALAVELVPSQNSVAECASGAIDAAAARSKLRSAERDVEGFMSRFCFWFFRNFAFSKKLWGDLKKKEMQTLGGAVRVLWG